MALSAECSRNCGSAMFRLRLLFESPGFQEFFFFFRKISTVRYQCFCWMSAFSFEMIGVAELIGTCGDWRLSSFGCRDLCIAQQQIVPKSSVQPCCLKCIVITSKRLYKCPTLDVAKCSHASIELVWYSLIWSLWVFFSTLALFYFRILPVCC